MKKIVEALQVVDKYLMSAGAVMVARSSGEYADWERIRAIQRYTPDILDRVALTLPPSGVRGDLVAAPVTAADFAGRPRSWEEGPHHTRLDPNWIQNGRRWKLYWVRVGMIIDQAVIWEPDEYAVGLRLPLNEYGPEPECPYPQVEYTGTMVEFIVMEPGEELWEKQQRDAEWRRNYIRNRIQPPLPDAPPPEPVPIIRIRDFFGFFRVAKEGDIINHPSVYYNDARPDSEEDPDADPDADVVQLYHVEPGRLGG